MVNCVQQGGGGGGRPGKRGEGGWHETVVSGRVGTVGVGVHGVGSPPHLV